MDAKGIRLVRGVECSLVHTMSVGAWVAVLERLLRVIQTVALKTKLYVQLKVWRIELRQRDRVRQIDAIGRTRIHDGTLWTLRGGVIGRAIMLSLLRNATTVMLVDTGLKVNLRAIYSSVVGVDANRWACGSLQLLVSTVLLSVNVTTISPNGRNSSRNSYLVKMAWTV